MQWFLAGAELSKAIGQILGENGCRCAVAFWGTGARELLSPENHAARLVCNLKSGGTNPHEIERFPRNIVKQHETLHAKVYIGQSRAIVCSANVSANGLGREGGEQAHWSEAGILTDDTAAIAEWFDAIWKASRDISPEDIKNAKALWHIAQRNRPSLRSIAEFIVGGGEVPLLYPVPDTEWEYSSDDLDPEQRTQIDMSLAVARGDREAMAPGKWLLVWELSDRRRNPYWFFTGPLLEKAFHYRGERRLRDSVLMDKMPPRQPFTLTPDVVGIMRSVISQPAFTDLLATSDDEPFYTAARLKLNRRFWEACANRAAQRA
jgi:hypothetical protein